MPKPVWLVGWSVGLLTGGSRVRFRSKACTLVAGTSPIGGVVIIKCWGSLKNNNNKRPVFEGRANNFLMDWIRGLR
ncbi:hypothetical protein QTO34_000228 [Cnephaeus nilssonii]|uniref:Uncharacterized protein n=1 Tax=Cnephaeus nilssonii TaxID=3371016 RepID=A0AA40IB13_CNENI|nr:hypothetical protein QTO34_000228 [Eptesicus nilssonii]